MLRTTAREIAVHLSFELGFTHKTADELLDGRLTREAFDAWREEDEVYGEFPGPKQQSYIRQLVSGVGGHSAELDSYIEKYAVGWSFSRISRVASAIMRVAMFEILYMPDIPNSAAINEAVEIAKKYEEPEVVSFINGILGSFLRKECGEQPPSAVTAPETESGEDGEPPKAPENGEDAERPKTPEDGENAETPEDGEGAETPKAEEAPVPAGGERNEISGD